jgi:hypothetical protein
MEITDLFPIAQDLRVLFPDGTDTGVTLRVIGSDSSKFRAVAKKYAQLSLGKEHPTVDEMDNQNAELCAVCVVGWTGLTENGEELPYSQEKALELMRKPELTFIREQVEGFVSKRANFFRKSKGPADCAGSPEH